MGWLTYSLFFPRCVVHFLSLKFTGREHESSLIASNTCFRTASISYDTKASAILRLTQKASRHEKIIIRFSLLLLFEVSQDPK